MDETIIVTGFRASLESAVAEKKLSDQIVESVTAEDIGKLPDASIGESIARLPGLTAQRLNGRANVVAIRGFGPDFSQTLLNGREQTTTSDNRSVELDQYPSEIVNQVVVYKSPTASWSGGASSARSISARSARSKPASRSSPWARAVVGRYRRAQRRFARIRLSRQRHLRRPVRRRYARHLARGLLCGRALPASGIQRLGLCRNAGEQPGCGADRRVQPRHLDTVEAPRRQRQLQWQPMPQRPHRRSSTPISTTTSPSAASNSRSASARSGRRSIRLHGRGRARHPGQFDNVRGVIRNDVFQRKADLYSGGFNALYSDDGWTAFFDFGYSRTDRNELSLESYSGTGFNGPSTGRGSAATIGFTSGDEGTVFNPSLDYSDPARIFLTDPLGWGGGAIPQAGYSNNRIIEDELFQFRGEVEEFDGGFAQRAVRHELHDAREEPDAGRSFRRPLRGAIEAILAIPLRATDLTISASAPSSATIRAS